MTTKSYLSSISPISNYSNTPTLSLYTCSSCNTLRTVNNITSPIASIASSDLFSVSPHADTSPNCLLPYNTVSDTTHYVTNILLILFRHHPSGVLQSELASVYYQTYGEHVPMTKNMKCILRTHRAIRVATTQKRGTLYTLNGAQLLNTLQLFHPISVKQYIAEHVLRLLNLFPNGIACICFEETLLNISQFKISHVIPNWIHFIYSIPYVVYFKLNGVDIFINTIHSGGMFSQFDASKVLTKPVGYRTLFESLPTNANSCVNPQEFERSFAAKYVGFKIYCEAPSIAPILKRTQINPIISDLNISNKSPFSEDHCSVFMGGFPHGTNIFDIRRELILMGFVVINCTDIKYRKYGFTWVTLSNVAEADYLIQISPIMMLGVRIDIRPYINREKQKNEKPDDKLILQTMIGLLSSDKYIDSGLSLRDMQPILYQKLSHRISVTHLLEIIEQNTKQLQIKTDDGQTQRILYICS